MALPQPQGSVRRGGPTMWGVQPCGGGERQVLDLLSLEKKLLVINSLSTLRKDKGILPAQHITIKIVLK